MRIWGLEPHVRIRYAVEAAIQAFARRDDAAGVMAYEVATASLDAVTHPLAFLESFILVEHVNRQYIQFLGE